MDLDRKVVRNIFGRRGVGHLVLDVAPGAHLLGHGDEGGQVGHVVRGNLVTIGKNCGFIVRRVSWIFFRIWFCICLND